MRNSLIAILLVLLAAAGYFSFTNQGAPSTASDSKEVYEDSKNGFRFSYAEGATVVQKESRQIEYAGEAIETVPLPSGSVEVEGLIVSAVPYEDFSKEKPIYNYFSGSTGERYWYDAATFEWKAESVNHGTDGAVFSPLPLSENGECKIAETFGTHPFYKILSGDEGIPTDVYYFLPTDKGYAIRFLAPYDVKADYSAYPAEIRPDQTLLNRISEILSSVELTNGVQAVAAGCL